jgi:hypothetical protein
MWLKTDLVLLANRRWDSTTNPGSKESKALEIMGVPSFSFSSDRHPHPQVGAD